MTSLLIFLTCGAVIAALFEHRQIAGNTAREIAKIRAMSHVNLQDRRYGVSYVIGVYLAPVLAFAALGAIIGAICWLAWEALAWVFG